MSEVVRNAEEARALVDNVVIGADVADWGTGARFDFAGKGNILYLEEGVKLGSVSVRFPGNNALIVLRASRHRYQLHLDAWSSTLIYLGKDCYYNKQLSIICSEGCQVVVGDGCLFSFDIWIRTADPHLVYDVHTHQRINPSASVFVGDHVWVGQDAIILKGSRIGSGSIVGAKSVVAGKRIPSNESWAGNPARSLRQGIFWEGSSVHNWGPEQTARRQVFERDDFIFVADGDTVAMDDVLGAARRGTSAAERLEALQASALWESRKNRFFVAGASPSRLPKLRKLWGRRGRKRA